ncbi:hypothetical protein F5Y16DRAFT_366276 [Xylariaceae sp. FL0255]|nr:hypothetical protein F5Y16DRAFT_366276 [Xylariaceae sp. FL0255]
MVGETEKINLLRSLRKEVHITLRPQTVEEQEDEELRQSCGSVDLGHAFSWHQMQSLGKPLIKLGKIEEIWTSRRCAPCRLIAAICPSNFTPGDETTYELRSCSSTDIWLCQGRLACLAISKMAG